MKPFAFLKAIPYVVYMRSNHWATRRAKFINDYFNEPICEVCQIAQEDVPETSSHSTKYRRPRRRGKGGDVPCFEDPPHDLHSDCEATSVQVFSSEASLGFTVHHMTYENIGEEADEDLKLVCEPCHKIIHSVEDQGWMLNWLELRELDDSLETIRSLAPLRSFHELYGSTYEE